MANNKLLIKLLPFLVPDAEHDHSASNSSVLMILRCRLPMSSFERQL